MTRAPVRRLRRFAGAAVVLAVVAALPALAAARPAPADRAETTDQVLQAVRASAGRSYSGYAESHGTAAIPDVSELGNLPSLLGDTNRLRVWWSAPDRWRVDQLGPTSENGTYAFDGGTWEWQSPSRTATEVTAVAPVRFPRAADLTPDQLGRRLASLASAPSSHERRIGARRYAGRTALGVEITGGPTTTVGAVDIWADERTGVPLAVTITARGQRDPTISTSYLSFDAAAPKAGTDTFTPPADAQVQEVDDNGLRGVLGRLRPFDAPEVLAGLPASSVIVGADAVATYADGLSQLTVVSLSRGDAARLGRDLAAVSGPATGDLQELTTPLITVELLDLPGRHLLVAGTVTPATAAAAVTALRGGGGIAG